MSGQETGAKQSQQAGGSSREMTQQALATARGLGWQSPQSDRLEKNEGERCGVQMQVLATKPDAPCRHAEVHLVERHGGLLRWGMVRCRHNGTQMLEEQASNGNNGKGETTGASAGRHACMRDAIAAPWGANLMYSAQHV